MEHNDFPHLPDCPSCLADLEHCHEVSVEHADGSTECLGLEPCGLSHDLHEWHLSCSALEPPCPCATDEQVPPLLVAPALAA
ncbi:MAG TPA: hypothetical protein VGF22_06125 [Acidimicrobiales bacterium]|jgi:hypothetical protein